jgi:hypothetical protein
MELEEKVHLLFVLRQAQDIMQKKLENLKVEIENEIKLGHLVDQITDEYGTARLENRPVYEVGQLAIRDALVNGFITYDELYEKNCISFRGGEIFKHFPEFVIKTDHESLVVRLEKLGGEETTLDVLCQCPKYWRGEE